MGHRGEASDPKGRAGLAQLAADVMTKGTATRSATQIVDAVESLGGTIGGDASRDGSTLAITVKSDELEPAMAVFADVALHPAFAPAEIDRARAQAIDGLMVSYKTPGSLAAMVASRLVYGDGPYGAPADGTPASLKAITRADIAGAYAATWRPDTTTLVIAGDITVDRAQALAERLFGGWRAPPTPAPAPPAMAPLPAPRFVVIDLPGSPQAAVMIARATITRGDPRYYPMLVANTALGGGYSSRLNQQVRVKRGLAYGAGSSFRAGRLPGPLSVATQTKNATAPEVVTLMAGEMRGMGAAPVPAAELAARKATLSGAFGSRIETTDGLAGVAAGLVTQDVDPAEIDRYAQRIEAVTADEVEQVSKALIDPAAASTVVVGDAASFMAGLKAEGKAPELIPAAKLDLGTPALQ